MPSSHSLDEEIASIDLCDIVDRPYGGLEILWKNYWDNIATMYSLGILGA